MRTQPFDIPRFSQSDDGAMVVTRWGRVDGMVLRPGDRLVLGERQVGLLALVSIGPGRPMLGRRTPRGLQAEPGGVPALEARWRVAGSVDSIERELERGPLDTASRWVAVRFLDPVTGKTVVATEQLAMAFSEGEYDHRELDELCLHAAVAVGRFGVAVALGAGAGPEQARLLADSASPGHVRYGVAVEPVALVAVGGSSREVAPTRGTVLPFRRSLRSEASQLKLFDEYSRPRQIR